MEFEVDINQLEISASVEKNICDELFWLATDLEKCRKSLQQCLSSGASFSIDKSIRVVNNRLEMAGEKLGIMGEKLVTISRMYSNTENSILENRLDKGKITVLNSENQYQIVNKNGFNAELLSKLLGIEEKDKAADIVNIISKLAKKFNDKTAFGIVGDGLKYLNTLQDFICGVLKGDINSGTMFDLAKDSGALWNTLYNFFDKNLVLKANNGKQKEFKVNTILGESFGNTIGYVTLFSSFTTFFKNYDETLNGEYGSWQETIGAWLEEGKEGVNVMKSAYNLSNMSKGVVDKAAKGKAGWFTLGETALNTVGQGFKSYGKYNSDGNITVEEGAEIAIESSVKGLTTLVSGVVDIDSDAAADALEDWGRQEGASIGNIIAANPKMKYKFQNGNIFEQIEAFGWGVANRFGRKIKQDTN